MKSETDLHQPTLLVVDDEEGPRTSLKFVFKGDFNVLMAASGPEAIKLVSENEIDVAILDIRMPDMTGTELLGKLKAIDPDIEVMMLTAYETIETARQALRLGACEYLNKPFAIPDIKKAVAKALERRTFSNQVKQNSEQLAQLQSEIESYQMGEEMHRTRGEIYASIIHDINGPLTVISGFFELINLKIEHLDKIEGKDLDMVKDRLARMTRQVSNCIEISRRYLAILRNQSSVGAKTRCSQILNDLWELLKFHPSLRQNEVEIHPVQPDIEIQINGTDLVQTLLNLCINALQSSKEKHRVEVITELTEAPMPLAQFRRSENEYLINDEQFRNEGKVLTMTVKDNGPGIPPEVVEKIFTTYFTTKAEGKGTGLGLTIVQRLVKENQGLLHLKTKVGEGTSFTIYLPVSG